MNYAKHVSRSQTPQSEPIPGTAQVENSAGGYSWAVDDWTRLDRFIVLGHDGPSYYADERKLTKESAACVERLLQVDGPRVVARVVEISDAGRAPKNDPAIFALALALKLGDGATKRAARAAVPKVCRIGTHIFQLAEAVKHLGGWGRGTKGAFADWYLSQSPEQLALNLAKYQSRGGWAHRDVLRKAHVKPKTPAQDAMLRWAVNKPIAEDKIGPVVTSVIGAFEKAKIIGALGVNPTDVRQMAQLITDTGLPRECVPTEFLNAPEVWDALLRSGKYGMPLTAMIRNLGKMSAIELLKPLSGAAKFVCERLRDKEALKAARVHPIQLLLALATYRQGQGEKGKLTWEVSTEVCTALDDAFYGAFANVEPTGKRYFLALDISGSMATGRVAGTSLTPREASAAMALVTARTESRHEVVGFTAVEGQLSPYSVGYAFQRASQNALTQIPGVNARASLPDAIRAVSGLPMGNTDCALPMVMAKKHKLEVDVFIVLTDSETWAGPIHAAQALRDYRQSSGIPAQLITCAMVANSWSICDPNDRGSLDVCGFDSNVPAVIADFVRGG